MKERKLCNVLAPEPEELNAEQREDLLSVSKVGRSRMSTYIRQYVLYPPTEIRQKRRRSKLKTFSKPKSGIQTQKSQVSRLSKMAKSLAIRLKQSGHFYDRVLEFPLAICDEFGQMRSRTKSAFKQAILQIPQLLTMFSPTSLVSFAGSEVIIDALKFIHCPPEPSISTYSEYVQDLFHKMVQQLGSSRGANYITLVFDKPMFLPGIRQTVHLERKKRTVKTRFTCPEAIGDDDNIPQGELFAEALTDARYKSMLIDYISVSFPLLAKSQHLDAVIIIDSDIW